MEGCIRRWGASYPARLGGLQTSWIHPNPSTSLVSRDTRLFFTQSSGQKLVCFFYLATLHNIRYLRHGDALMDMALWVSFHFQVIQRITSLSQASFVFLTLLFVEGDSLA